MDRRTARETAFVMLFEKMFKPEDTPEDIKRIAEDYRELVPDEYIERVFVGACDKQAEIDEIIEKHSIGWKTERMSKTSLAIMRLAAYEILYEDDIPFNVSINEAVELAKKFDHEKSPSFINGILNSIADEGGFKTR